MERRSRERRVAAPPAWRKGFQMLLITSTAVPKSGASLPSDYRSVLITMKTQSGRQKSGDIVATVFWASREQVPVSREAPAEVHGIQGGLQWRRCARPPCGHVSIHDVLYS